MLLPVRHLLILPLSSFKQPLLLLPRLCFTPPIPNHSYPSYLSYCPIRLFNAFFAVLLCVRLPSMQRWVLETPPKRCGPLKYNRRYKEPCIPCMITFDRFQFSFCCETVSLPKTVRYVLYCRYSAVCLEDAGPTLGFGLASTFTPPQPYQIPTTTPNRNKTKPGRCTFLYCTKRDDFEGCDRLGARTIFTRSSLKPVSRWLLFRGRQGQVSVHGWRKIQETQKLPQQTHRTR